MCFPLTETRWRRFGAESIMADQEAQPCPSPFPSSRYGSTRGCSTRTDLWAEVWSPESCMLPARVSNRDSS